MRRIALAAALAATLAGGAAALAATPDPGTPDAAPPDPYQGAWALTIDGRLAGPVTQVQGCGLAAPIINDAATRGKHLGSPAPEACTFQVGAGMSADFTNLVNDGLAGFTSTHTIELVRTDATTDYGLLIRHAVLSSVALPKIDRAATTPVFLEVGIAGDSIVRDPSPLKGGRPLPPRGFDPSQLQVRLNGQPLGASSAGPWEADVETTADQVGAAREAVRTMVATDIGNLPLRVPENSKAMSRVIDPWVNSALITRAASAEQPVQLTVGTLSLTLDHAAPQRADLVPRADGARTYSLYAEHAVVAAG